MTTDIRKIAIIVVLAIVFIGVLWWQFRPSEEERRIKENFAKSQAQQASGQTSKTPVSTPATAPAGGRESAVTSPAAGTGAQGAAPSGSQSKSVFKKSNVNLDELLASVKEVDFDYQKERTERNPMRPLVGKSAPNVLAKGARAAMPQAAETIIRSMRVTGIIYNKKDPLAVINDRVVRKGYAFDSNLVVEDIEPTRVLLRANDAVIPIEMEEP